MIHLGLFIVGLAVGWGLHLWYCQRRNGCPLWRQLDTGEWVRRLAASGWRTKNGVRHYPRPDHERHPSGAVPIEALDETARSGVPSRLTDTPTTGVANPKRKT